MDQLPQELKEKIIDILNLEHLSPSDIGDDELLFDEKIGLDSIDALELIVLLEKDYGLKVTSKEEGMKIFRSVDTIADFIRSSKIS